MKLASLKGGRDGVLVVVSRNLEHAVRVPDIAVTMQSALDRWAVCAPLLEQRYADLNAGDLDGAFAFEPAGCASPLPRAYQWADGSAYLNHVELVRKARGAEVPASFFEDPLMYQGGSDNFVGPRDDIRLQSDAWGLDFEAEVTVVTDDVPMGSTPAEALAHVKLVMLVNDVSRTRVVGRRGRLSSASGPSGSCHVVRVAGSDRRRSFFASAPIDRAVCLGTRRPSAVELMFPEGLCRNGESCPQSST